MQLEPIDLNIHALTKLDRLIAQADVIISSEHPNLDSKDAVVNLKSQVEILKRKLDGYNQYPENLKNALLRQTNFTILQTMDLLGFIVRSTTTRNLFELYYPFREVARALVGGDVKLIISSDWQFSPFTYPFGLEELPNYVLIGLPAFESENVLVFPTAGHELGHTVWMARNFASSFGDDIEDQIYLAYEAQRDRFERVFAQKGVDLRNDMFAQPWIRKSISYATRQLEELFCDAIGYLIFGNSYIFAFDYLIAPTIVGRRSGEYPASKTRIEYLQNFAVGLGVEPPALSHRFVEDKLSGHLASDFTIEMADIAVSKICLNVFQSATAYVHKHLPNCFDQTKIESISASFQMGRPVGESLSLGNLLNAAWDLYNDPKASEKLASHGVDLVPFLTDMVIKSAESLEFQSFRDAQHKRSA